MMKFIDLEKPLKACLFTLQVDEGDKKSDVAFLNVAYSADGNEISKAMAESMKQNSKVAAIIAMAVAYFSAACENENEVLEMINGAIARIKNGEE